MEGSQPEGSCSLDGAKAPQQAQEHTVEHSTVAVVCKDMGVARGAAAHAPRHESSHPASEYPVPTHKHEPAAFPLGL